MDWNLIWDGVLLTLWLTLASAVLSLIIGIIIAIMRTAPLPPLEALAAGYTEFFRNVPLLLVLFFFYYGLPNAGLRLSAINCAIWGLGLYTAAYVAEVIRAGLAGVSKGNLEAARSLGLNFMQMIRYVQLPQALRSAIPPLGTLLIALLKNTSLAGAITIPELLFQGDLIGSRTFNPYILPIIGLIYVALTLPIAGAINLVERRWAIKR